MDKVKCLRPAATLSLLRLLVGDAVKVTREQEEVEP
jgi:hypothetical protein